MKEIEVELTKTTQERVKTVIQLPIYRRHIVGDYSTIYTKINEDLSAVHITDTWRSWDACYHDGFEVEYEQKYVFDGSKIDYHLGQGRYALSTEEFSEVVRRMWKWLGEICPNE